MIPKLRYLSIAFLLGASSAAAGDSGNFDTSTRLTVALDRATDAGPASLRESAVAWHPGRQCYYLVADVIPLDSPHHPNTYGTELHLWRSADLYAWTYLGVAVPRGQGPDAYDAHGVASPSAMAYRDGRLYVAFSARRTPKFDKRGVGLAWSGDDPEDLPWTKSPRPISDLPGEDDDPGVLAIPGDDRLHCYHRTTGGSGGYRIVHTASSTPEDPSSWSTATDVTRRPPGVRAQELTGVAWLGNRVHLFIIEQGDAVEGAQVAHLASPEPAARFGVFDPGNRYLTLPHPRIAYGGHFTPVLRERRLVAAFWTTFLEGKRYGLVGHPAAVGE